MPFHFSRFSDAEIFFNLEQVNASVTETEEITVDNFKKSWLENSGITSDNNLENGRKFAHRLFIEWKQINEDDADLTTLDDSGDGGLDVSYLERGKGLE